MAWTVSLPGQPPSLNDLYRVAPRVAKDGRRYAGIIKNPAASQYHDDAIWLIRAARPSSWKPAGDFRIQVRFFLARKIDTDNCLKVLSDAIQTAIRIDDAAFLWCIVSREVGVKEPRVELVFLDDASHTH